MKFEKVNLRSFFTAIICLLALTGCGNGPKVVKEGIPKSYLRAQMQETDEVLNLDPAGKWEFGTIDVFNAIFDSLFLINSEGQVIPGLARDLPQISNGGKTYRIQLREGIPFHEDDCFSASRTARAEDFIYSIKRIAHPNNKTGLWSLLAGKIVGLDAYREGVEQGKVKIDDPIEGLKATDDLSLEINLTRPFSQFLYILSMPSFGVVPREAVEKYGDDFKHHPIGTGPFRLERFSKKEILLKRIDHEWRFPKKLTGFLPDGIAFINYDDPWNALKEGLLDIHLITSNRLHAYVDKNYQIKEELKKTGIWTSFP